MLPPPTTLTDGTVLLRPLAEVDREPLYRIAADPELWAMHQCKDRHERPVFDAMFDDALANPRSFAILDVETGAHLGSTRFAPVSNIVDADDAVEIGWTYIDRNYWGTGTNGRVKQLMIDYAFRYLPHIVWQVDRNNFRSRGAVRKLGARELPTDHRLATRKPTGMTFLLSRPS